MDRSLQPATIAVPRCNGIDGRSVLALTILLALVFTSWPVSAQVHALVRPVNLAMLATRAEVIVQGHVVEARQEPMPGYPNIRTVVVTIEVEHMLRGPAVGRFTFRQYLGGGGERNRTVKSGYASGEHVLLFLPGESSYGLRSPLGLEQGHFLIRREANGQEMIANQMANSGLFYRVAEAAQRAGMKLDDDQLQLVTTPRGAVPLRNFTSLLKDLMRLPRNE